MTREEFKAACRVAMAEEFSHIPAGEESIDYAFSEGFTKRMEKLIRSERSVWWRWVNTAGKRAAVIVAAVLVLFSMAMSVKAIREPVVNFFVEFFAKYNLIEFEGDTSKVIEQEYQLTWVPEGYTHRNVTRSALSITTIYDGTNKGMLVFEQVITGAGDISLDNEKGTISYITVGETPILVYEAKGVVFMLWTFDTYYFTLTSCGNLDIETLSNIVRNIQ